jgi:hypothetical protein
MFIGHLIVPLFGEIVLPGNQAVAIGAAILLCGALGALGLPVSRLAS